MTNFPARDITRPDLKDLQPYEPVNATGMIRLDANECPFAFPAEAKEYIFENLEEEAFNRYPDPLATELISHLASYAGVPENWLLAGNGSDEMILNLALTFGTGGTVLINTPTFSMYEIHSRVAGAKPVAVPRRDDFSLDMEQLVSREARMIFICSPNNPTGNETPREELEAVLKNTRSLVVVDEAYVEFGGQTALPLLQAYPQLVILRSFSKSFGMAGLRVGYLIARPEVVEEVKRIKQPFNLNAFSQKAAVAVLKNLPLFQARIKKIIQLREQLAVAMKQLAGITVFPSAANFITFRPQRTARKVFQGLLDRGILIRNVSSPGLENCLRVSVGTAEENEQFITALSGVLSESEVCKSG